MTVRGILDALTRYKSLNVDNMGELLDTTNSKIDTTNTKITDILNKLIDLSDVDGNLKINILNSEILVPQDLQTRWSEAVTLLGSGARTASGTGSAIDVSKFSVLRTIVNVTAVSGTFAAGEGLVVYVDGYHSLAGVWENVYESDVITAPVNDFFTLSFYTEPPLAYEQLRVRWDISGTTPSFTFGVYAQAKV